ncbi:unnamed protein product, partial [Ectocarpus sp. 6 AP-2014]
CHLRTGSLTHFSSCPTHRRHTHSKAREQAHAPTHPGGLLRAEGSTKEEAGRRRDILGGSSSTEAVELFMLTKKQRWRRVRVVRAISNSSVSSNSSISSNSSNSSNDSTSDGGGGRSRGGGGTDACPGRDGFDCFPAL